MKRWTAVAAVMLNLLLVACNNPIIIPADMAVTLPANQDYILHATLPVTPTSALESGTASLTPSPTLTASVTLPPTATLTRTPVPTRKPIFPVAPGNPLIDPGFQPIVIDNALRLTPVFVATKTSFRHSTISGDGQKLFVSTSDGTFVFNRQGAILAHWGNINTAAIECESCISTNFDGTWLAIITRNAGTWEAQLYDLQSDQPSLLLSIPLEAEFKGTRNEVSIAISPDDKYLAFRAGSGALRVLDMDTKLQALSYDRPVNGVSFSPDGSRFVIHAGQELLIYQVSDWKIVTNLLLPRDETPYSFSPDDSQLVLALPSILRVYGTNPIKLLREINVPPSNAITRQWQIFFSDDNILNGYAVSWDAYKKNAVTENGQWNIGSGEQLRFETSSSSTPDALSALWNSPIRLPATENGELEPVSDGYNAFRFISNDILLINSQHAACWLKLMVGETTCFKDPDHVLFASDTNTFKEILENSYTGLSEFRSGKINIQTGPYRVLAINRSGEWALINTGKGTDLYTRGKNLSQESVSGVLQGFAENITRIVFTTLEKQNTFTITVVNKATGDAIVQKKDNFLDQPVIMVTDGTIYYTQRELDRNQTIFNSIDPMSNKTNEITRISLPAEIKALALSTNGLFAAGLQDGSVLFLTKDGTQSVIFQAESNPIQGLSFSLDGRFLAISSPEGVRIFAVLPEKK